MNRKSIQLAVFLVGTVLFALQVVALEHQAEVINQLDRLACTFSLTFSIF